MYRNGQNFIRETFQPMSDSQLYSHMANAYARSVRANTEQAAREFHAASDTMVDAFDDGCPHYGVGA